MPDTVKLKIFTAETPKTTDELIQMIRMDFLLVKKGLKFQTLHISRVQVVGSCMQCDLVI